MSRFTFVSALALSLSMVMGTATTASACGVNLVGKVRTGPKHQVRAMAERRPLDSKDSDDGHKRFAQKEDRKPIAAGPTQPGPTVAAAEQPKPQPRPAPPAEPAVARAPEPKTEIPAAKPKPKPKAVRARPETRPEVAAAEPAARRDPLQVEVYFDLGASDTSDSLSEVVDWVQNQPGGRLVVEGYTDPSGSAGFNQRLSVKRARLIKQHLMEQTGLPSGKIKVRGFGESKLAYPQDDSRNRRVVIRGK